MRNFSKLFASLFLATCSLAEVKGHECHTLYSTENLDNCSKEHSLNLAFSQLQPETFLEQEIVSSVEWIKGASWGEPRSGHPEGAVIFHILEVLHNVDNYYRNSPLREKLRVISIVHDTFKNKVDFRLPKTGENHHAMIARRFAEKFTDDESILDVIQMHDDAYHAWNKGSREGNWISALELAHKLIVDLGPNLELYLSFYKCDNFTGDKTAEPYEWFKEIASHESSSCLKTVTK
jgi:hypothetical protein